MPPKPCALSWASVNISTFKPAANPIFLNRAQKDSGVKWLGGVLIKSRTMWVLVAMMLARLIPALDSALLADLVKIVTAASTALRSDFEVPRNSSNAYAPSSAPSAIAASSALEEWGSANVALFAPANERAAAPADRRSVSA